VEWIGAHAPFAGFIIPALSWLKHHRDAVRMFYPHHSNVVPSLRAYIKQSRFVVWGRMMLRAFVFLVKRRFRIDEMNFSGSNEHNEFVIQHNLWNNLKLFQFSRGRVEALLYPLLSVPGIKKDGKTLCIGPKNEGEMLLMEAHGFRDVIGIDLFTYSNKILLMDMHELRFPENMFDTIMSGAVIRYSYDVKKAVAEMIRVAKDGAILIVSFGLFPPEEELAFCQSPLFGGVKELLGLFGEHVDHVYWWNEGQVPGKKSRICSVIFRLKKTVPRAP
jgi:SAM-dependent methyltransferase